MMLRLYAEWLSEVATRPFSMVTVLAASILNVAASVSAIVLGAQVDDGLFAGLTLLILSTGIALVSWCLLAVVRLSTVVARLEAQMNENARRIDELKDDSRRR